LRSKISNTQRSFYIKRTALPSACPVLLLIQVQTEPDRLHIPLPASSIVLQGQTLKKNQDVIQLPQLRKNAFSTIDRKASWIWTTRDNKETTIWYVSSKLIKPVQLSVIGSDESGASQNQPVYSVSPDGRWVVYYPQKRSRNDLAWGLFDRLTLKKVALPGTGENGWLQSPAWTSSREITFLQPFRGKLKGKQEPPGAVLRYSLNNMRFRYISSLPSFSSHVYWDYYSKYDREFQRWQRDAATCSLGDDLAILIGRHNNPSELQGWLFGETVVHSSGLQIFNLSLRDPEKRYRIAVYTKGRKTPTVTSIPLTASKSQFAMWLNPIDSTHFSFTRYTYPAVPRKDQSALPISSYLPNICVWNSKTNGVTELGPGQNLVYLPELLSK
jgi:hypothetical protein